MINTENEFYKRALPSTVLGGLLRPTLVPRHSHCPVFDRLQYAKTEGQAWSIYYASDINDCHLQNLLGTKDKCMKCISLVSVNLPGLPPPFLHTVNGQKLDCGKAQAKFTLW